MPAMLGDEASELLGAAVAQANASVLSVRPVQVTWHPGRSLHVTYDALVAWNRNRRTAERFVAATGDGLPEAAVRLARDDEQVAVWPMSGDPALPGLAIAMDPLRVSELLGSLGGSDGPVSILVRAYRPGRRAVVEVSGDGSRVYLKVVPPASVAGLQERHRMLADSLPVPRSHGWSSEFGLVVLEALPGETLRSALKVRRRPLPAASDLVALLNRIPPVSDGRSSTPPLASATQHALLIGSLLPELACRVERLQAMLCEGEASLPTVPVHGDFHEAQVLVGGGEVVGLLDVDTVGLGHRIDDWANLIGHLSSLEAFAAREVRPRMAKFTRDALSAATEDTGCAGELRRRIAAVVLGMATGPFRAQSTTWPSDTRARVALAERWVADPQRIESS